MFAGSLWPGKVMMLCKNEVWKRSREFAIFSKLNKVIAYHNHFEIILHWNFRECVIMKCKRHEIVCCWWCTNPLSEIIMHVCCKSSKVSCTFVEQPDIRMYSQIFQCTVCVNILSLLESLVSWYWTCYFLAQNKCYKLCCVAECPYHQKVGEWQPPPDPFYLREVS